MLLMTTTPTVEGRPVKTYLAIVSGEALADVSGDVGGKIHDARASAMAQMSARAQKLGASAVVAVAVAFEPLNMPYTVVIATGTAVVL